MELWMLLSGVVLILVAVWLAVFGITLPLYLWFLIWVTVSLFGLPLLLIICFLVETYNERRRAACGTEVK